jgi:hypothetical protein
VEKAWKTLFRRLHNHWNEWIERHPQVITYGLPLDKADDVLQPESISDDVAEWQTLAMGVSRFLKKFQMLLDSVSVHTDEEAHDLLLDAVEESLRNRRGGSQLDADTSAWLAAGKKTLQAKQVEDKVARQKQYYAARAGLQHVIAWWLAAVDEVFAMTQKAMSQVQRHADAEVDPADLAAFLRGKTDSTWLAFRDATHDQLTKIRQSLLRQVEKEEKQVEEYVKTWDWTWVEDDLMHIEYSLRTYVHRGYEDTLLWIKTFAVEMIASIKTAQHQLTYEELKKFAAAWEMCEGALGAA